MCTFPKGISTMGNVNNLVHLAALAFYVYLHYFEDLDD